MKKRTSIWVATVSLILLAWTASAQINTGSDGHDGALNPTSNRVIDMADHPDGIYHYTSVNIPTNVTVTFIPNSKNTPVVWLVQGNCTINGNVDVSGQTSTTVEGAAGGPGGWRGGNGGLAANSGEGPGGGIVDREGGAASATRNYGNIFLIPLLGGSGGGALIRDSSTGGGGGGGAILIAASQKMTVNGRINALGGKGIYVNWAGFAGGGSGGAIRLVAERISGNGSIDASAGSPAWETSNGTIRFDCYLSTFYGKIVGAFTKGFQPIIIASANQPQLTVTSVCGLPVPPSPTGAIATPDAVISAQQGNPIPIVVQCSYVPLNTPITVSVKPLNGSPVSTVGYNQTGTHASSTATVTLNIPRGGGLIYATAAISR